MTDPNEIIAMLVKQNEDRYQDLMKITEKLFGLVDGHANMSAQLMSLMMPGPPTQSVDPQDYEDPAMSGGVND